ncbi:MAG TPA: hypothetical protein VM492_00645 [Sumerlaeia bacterium]|nr:hypothetical protein [Sumerlaeia bacterium]
MSSFAHFHTTDTRSLFAIIGSADRDLLREIGVTLGAEFQPSSEEEEGEEDFGVEEETEEAPEWDADAEEADSAQETIVKMILSGMSQDLSEDEAYAIQDYFASYAARSGRVHSIDPDDLADLFEADPESEQADEMRRILLEGMDLASLASFLDWLQENGASHELVYRLQMLYLGRLPEADEPTFTDLEEEAYAARFGYVLAGEAGRIADELSEFAARAPEEMRAMAALLATLMHYCNAEAMDLLVTIED